MLSATTQLISFYLDVFQEVLIYKIQGFSIHNTRNFLLTFLHGAVPSVNSIQSIWLNTERIIGYGLLNRIKKRLGYDKFPLIVIFLTHVESNLLAFLHTNEVKNKTLIII
jgi:hypothetical protein